MDTKKRNRFAGKGKNTRPKSNKKTGRDYTNQKEYNARPEEKKRRAELNRINRDNHASGKSKPGDGKDVSHTKKGTTTLESQSKNRARNRGKK